MVSAESDGSRARHIRRVARRHEAGLDRHIRAACGLSGKNLIMQKITPFLWFDGQAEAAAKFYTSIFKKSKILNVARYGEEGEKASGKPIGSVMTVAFEIAGQKFVALNGGPQFKFTEAVSFVVSCNTQKEVDYFWKKLSDGGREVQ